MRWLMAAMLSCGLGATPVLARDLQVTLDWPGLGQVPTGAEALFELRNAEGALLRRMRVPLDAGEAGLHTTLEDVPGPAASLRAGVLHRAQVIATMHAVTMPETRSLTLDPMELDPMLAIGFAQPMRCAEADLAFAMTDDGAIRMRHDAGVIVLPPLPDAPPGWFGAQASEVWLHGNRLQVTLDGADLGECVPVLGPVLLPFTATGRDSDWTLRITADAIALRLAGDEEAQARALPPIAMIDGRLEVDAGAFQVTLSDTICHDRLSGMPSPVLVGVETDAATLRGCGGDPGQLLRGQEWQVTGLLGVPVDAALAAFPELTMRFVNGRVSGRAACNLYFGDLEVGLSGLRFGQMATTRVACPPALQALERRFLDAMEAVTRFDIGREGVAIFYAGQSPVMTARR